MARIRKSKAPGEEGRTPYEVEALASDPGAPPVPDAIGTAGSGADAASRANGGATPSMAQFLEIKAANPDCILWYRMGDFYELFFEDAVVAAQALGIVLTKRGKHLGQDIPMCGVPVHRADDYLQRLIRRGYRVAVCEQLEDPAEARKRGSKAVVRRDVVRLVTPGTLTEEALLDARARNYLTALFQGPGTTDAPGAQSPPIVALASVDISTGEFEVGEWPRGDLAGELVRLAPSEVICADSQAGDRGIAADIRSAEAALTPVPAASFDSLAGERALKERLAVAELGGFGSFSRAELAAVGALLRYVDLTQLGSKPVLQPPRRTGSGALLVVDAASRASLELTRSSQGQRDGSLLAAMDRTVTGPGARELAARLASPLRDVKSINARLDAVQFLVERERVREDVRDVLRGAADMARAASRLSLNRGGPRDLAAIRDSLATGHGAAALLRREAEPIGLPADLARIVDRLLAPGDGVRQRLAAALIDEPPHLRRDGGFVRPGWRADLDEARQLRDDSRQVMAGLEAKYAEATGVRALKVRHNNQLGYYIEVSAANGRAFLAAPHDATFRHRQTLPNALRFSTSELTDVEGRIAASADRALAIEQEVFAELSRAVKEAEALLIAAAGALAEIDLIAGLAELAATENYVRPSLDDSTALDIRGGRHPVVEQALRRAGSGPFIDNDCALGRPEAPAAVPSGFEEALTAARIWLVTGPNMAGKSTYLRQNALIALMAQMGSFVPARSAHIGIVDRLFSRVGAADDLARGRSTFMVEMVETAGILNQATARSFVILDEIGRGTATFDGLSIAWATVEHLHEVNGCRTLFATHYHELTALSDRLAHVANVTVDIKEWQDDIVFLHKVRAGAANRSYGIQVAKLAGMPASVIMRAGEVLQVLEQSEQRPEGQRLSASLEDLPLFAAARPRSVAPVRGPSALEAAVDALNPDELTPKAALEALYRLREVRHKAKDGG